MTVEQWLKVCTDALNQSSITTARLDAEILLSTILGHDRTWLHAHHDTILSPTRIERARLLSSRRSKREPIAYIIGRKEFYGRDFVVTPDVLIPRPESETMVDLLRGLTLSDTASAIDIGTGSGCIGLTAALEYPQIIDLVLSDIGEEALAVAKRNNRPEYQLKHARFVRSDLLSHWMHMIRPNFDLILANLPYVDKTWRLSLETDFEPSLALFAEDGGLALIYRLITQAGTVLADNGYILLEADPEQHERIIEHGRQNGLRLETVRDYIVVLTKQQ